LLGIKLTQDEAIHFEDLEFITDRSDNSSWTPEGGDSSAIVKGMSYSGSPSLHAILEESPSGDDSASSEGESSSFPLQRACSVVISTIPIVTTGPLEETSVP
jgi:hypothetical protein